MSGRRAALPRHEFRVGRRELAIFGGAVLLVWALTLVFGVLLGRELAGARSGGTLATADPAKAPDRTPPVEPARKVERAVSEEKLSFYKTLTAPTLEIPPPSRPNIEERIVPHEPPVKPVAKAEPLPHPPSIPAAGPKAMKVPAERPPRRAERTPPVERPAPAELPAASTEPGAGREAAEAPGSGAGKAWTVQVSSFRSRSLADELRSRLASKGFDAYLMSVSTEDGRVRHRVRVGGFATRAEAEHVAGELRTERNLNPFVTTRAR
jgi:cell division septation protein DedD